MEVMEVTKVMKAKSTQAIARDAERGVYCRCPFGID
jgi:hypothetical protein